MADQPDQSEKTEEPTQKRLDDALKKGDVAKSQEVSTWFVLFAATLVIAMFSDYSASSVLRLLGGMFERIHEISVDSGGLTALLRHIGYSVLLALGLPFLLLIVAAVAGNMVQHRLVLSLDPIKPKLSKISPASGAKRLFGPTSLVNFAKGIAKLLVVGSLMFFIMWPNRGLVAGLTESDPSLLLATVKVLSLKILVGVVAIMAIIAALDYAYQRHRWHQKQKMTLKEVKDEFKQMEGDPHVRAKIRQVRMERGRQRMMSQVPEASVVITNPTHFSVALRYEEGMNAPICVAKGVDRIALKIREVAKENEIPIIENPPLARSLHAGMEVDDEIPEEHYKAVAQIIGYVMQLRKKSQWKS